MVVNLLDHYLRRTSLISSKISRHVPLILIHILLSNTYNDLLNFNVNLHTLPPNEIYSSIPPGSWGLAITLTPDHTTVVFDHVEEEGFLFIALRQERSSQ